MEMVGRVLGKSSVLDVLGSKAYVTFSRTRSPQLTEDERDRRTVFVQQLAARLRTKELIAFFEKVGPVKEAQIVKDKVSGRSKGYDVSTASGLPCANIFRSVSVMSSLKMKSPYPRLSSSPDSVCSVFPSSHNSRKQRRIVRLALALLTRILRTRFLSIVYMLATSISVLPRPI